MTMRPLRKEEETELFHGEAAQREFDLRIGASAQWEKCPLFVCEMVRHSTNYKVLLKNV